MEKAIIGIHYLHPVRTPQLVPHRFPRGFEMLENDLRRDDTPYIAPLPPIANLTEQNKASEVKRCFIVDSALKVQAK